MTDIAIHTCFDQCYAALFPNNRMLVSRLNKHVKPWRQNPSEDRTVIVIHVNDFQPDDVKADLETREAKKAVMGWAIDFFC
jgi:hypothetical protein